MTAPFDAGLWVSALPVLLAATLFTWLLSLPMRNVNAANPTWSLMLFAAGVIYALGSDPRAPRLSLVLWPLAIWSARLAVADVVRNAGNGEEPGFLALRARHEPFWLKSLYLVFLPRTLLAWIVSLPLLGAFASLRPISWLDYAGLLLWLAGFAFEAVADWQRDRFRRNPAHADAVLERGLWRYTRHPNFFGAFCCWWGFWLIALSAGAWWTLPGPVILGWMLLRRAAGNRRPQDADYVLKTNAFFPGPPRK